LIGRTTQPLLDTRLLEEVIGFAPHYHGWSRFLSYLCRKQVRQGSGIAIQAIEPNDHVGERKRNPRSIGRNHAARPPQFVAIQAIAGVSKGAQKLMGVRLQDRGPCSHHFPALASQMSRSTHPVKAAMGRRQVWGCRQSALAGSLFGAIHIDEQPASLQPVPESSWQRPEWRAGQQIFQKQGA
jgi:hypothetical protein